VPDRFLVGLAVLGLVSEAAGEQPLVCVVDDEHWLDRASVQALGFVARRLAADPVGLVFAARVPGAELAGLPELAVEGLGEQDARALLDSVLAGPVDARVRDLTVAETRGNPLAVFDAVALRFTAGHMAAAAALSRALDLFIALDADSAEARRWLWLADGRAGGTVIALELWDFESWRALAARQVRVARDTGALVQLQYALNFLARVHILAGEVSAAGRLIDEDRLIADATGNPPAGYATLIIAAWQGREQEAAELIQATAQKATGHGTGRLAGAAAYATAVLNNGLGRYDTARYDTARYDTARDAVREVFQHDHPALSHMVVAELAEAAARTGDTALVRAALDWLSQRTQVTRTEWVLGSRPASAPCSPTPRTPTASTANRSSGWPGPRSAPNSPAPACCTANGYAGRAAAPTPANNRAPPTACSTKWA
jgi:hypothetical protein